MKSVFLLFRYKHNNVQRELRTAFKVHEDDYMYKWNKGDK